MVRVLCTFLTLGALSGNLVSASILDSTKYIFTFGDSYTSIGWGGSGDPLQSQNPTTCTTAGPNWAQQFNELVDHTQLISLAVSGATSDSSIVFASPPDFRSQVTSFTTYVTPATVEWTGSNALFTVSFGTNDVNNSYKGTTGNGTDLYNTDLNSYFATVDRLYQAGARRFLFNGVVPFDRAQIGIGAGATLQAKLKESIDEFNHQLAAKALAYCASKADITCSVFDTHALFTKIMDSPSTYGFATANGTCIAYSSYGGCTVAPTSSACLGPPSVYVWKDDLHPAYGADALWATGVFDQLSSSELGGDI